MYPRFLQMILEIQTENKHPYLAIVFTKKILEIQTENKHPYLAIRAKLEENAELTKDVLGKDLSEQDFVAKRMNQGTWKISQLKKLKFKEIKEEFEKLVKQIDTFVPINIEATKAQLKIYGEVWFLNLNGSLQPIKDDSLDV
ncbi:hypothetical protein Tco_0131608 [Tanacetum coccineum]